MEFWRQHFWKNVSRLGNSFSSFAIAFIALLGERNLGVKVLAGLVMMCAVVIVIRLVYHKERPKKRPTTSILKRIDAAAFPSMHASRAFFVAMTITRFYQEALLGGMLFILAVLVAFARYQLQEHDMIDVIGGVLLGMVTSYGVENWIALRW